MSVICNDNSPTSLALLALNKPYCFCSRKSLSPGTPCEKVGQNKQSFLCPVSSLGLEEQSVKCAAPFKPGRWFLSWNLLSSIFSHQRTHKTSELPLLQRWAARGGPHPQLILKWRLSGYLFRKLSIHHLIWYNIYSSTQLSARSDDQWNSAISESRALHICISLLVERFNMQIAMYQNIRTSRLVFVLLFYEINFLRWFSFI